MLWRDSPIDHATRHPNLTKLYSAGMPFADGRPLGKAAVELVPAAALGRMLDPQEARALQESFAVAAPDTAATCQEQAAP